MAFFICIILSVIYAMPYGFNFHEEEKNFEKATILVIAPNKGERKIKLKPILMNTGCLVMGLKRYAQMI